MDYHHVISATTIVIKTGQIQVFVSLVILVLIKMRVKHVMVVVTELVMVVVTFVTLAIVAMNVIVVTVVKGVNLHKVTVKKTVIRVIRVKVA